MKIKNYSKLTLSNPELNAYMTKFNILQNKDIIFPHEETIDENHITNEIIKNSDIIIQHGLLNDEQIIKTFELLGEGKINKESIQIIFEQIMSKKADSVLQALEKASITQLTNEELDKILDDIIQKNMNKIKEEQSRALSGLMGIAMKEVRGKASGKIINEKLKEKIQNFLN